MYADQAHQPVVLERADGVGGELVLRRTGEHLEIISNGVFLMDTRDGTSERLLVQAALDQARPGARLLIGGLGVGFSLAEAARSDAAEITVIEREPAVVRWHATHLAPFSAGALHDPRVRVVRADLLDWLRGTTSTSTNSSNTTDIGTTGIDTTRTSTGPRTGDVYADGIGAYDALCLDIDNGPDWTVTDGNAALYGPEGLDLAARRLTPGGVLAVWSANASPAFEDRLRTRFHQVETRRIPVPRGEPDIVYLAAHVADLTY